jgi:peptide deformylase
MQIVYWPDERLLRRTRPVKLTDSEELADLEEHLRRVMAEEHGFGIAAPQVGSNLRACLVKWHFSEPPELLINPEITGRAKRLLLGDEGCLSFPGLHLRVWRHEWVDVAWTDGVGNRREERVMGLPGVCVQHEIDHLEGKTFLDRVKKRDRKEALRRWDPPHRTG